MKVNYKPLHQSDISRAVCSLPGDGSETVNVIRMPEFDGLLDHIYEHGTAAEGDRGANGFGSGRFARYAPPVRRRHRRQHGARLARNCNNCAHLELGYAQVTCHSKGAKMIDITKPLKTQ